MYMMCVHIYVCLYDTFTLGKSPCRIGRRRRAPEGRCEVGAFLFWRRLGESRLLGLGRRTAPH